MQNDKDNTENGSEIQNQVDSGHGAPVKEGQSARMRPESWLRDMISDDRIITAIVFVNTMIIFINGYYPQSRALALIDSGFTFFFLLEALLKIDPWNKGWNKGWKDYWSLNWNKFDFIVLALALPSIGEPFFDSTIHTNALLALRCLRVFKLFKIFRRLPNHDNLLVGLKLAFKTSFYIIVSFILFLIVFAVLSSALFSEFAPQYFGNPGLSLYNIFKLFTVEGWYELPDAIAANSSYAYGLFARFYFSILLFVGGIIGVSLINSVFVDAMATDNNKDVINKLESLEGQLQRLSRQLEETHITETSSPSDQEDAFRDDNATPYIES